MITVAENVQTIVFQIYLCNGISATLITVNLTKCTTVQVTVITTLEIISLMINPYVLLTTVKLLKKMVHANFALSLIMWLMVFVSIKDHVLSIIQQQVSAESVEKGII